MNLALLVKSFLELRAAADDGSTQDTQRLAEQLLKTLVPDWEFEVFAERRDQ